LKFKNKRTAPVADRRVRIQASLPRGQFIRQM
jgi:hypothetical protein